LGLEVQLALLEELAGGDNTSCKVNNDNEEGNEIKAAQNQTAIESANIIAERQTAEVEIFEPETTVESGITNPDLEYITPKEK
jgi:hypothetical protein